MPVWLSYPSRLSTGGVPAKPASSPSPSSPPPPTSATKHVLLYFVPGNPGFIDYYEPFLSTLRTLLDDVETKTRAQGGTDIRFHLLGRNLLGFEDGDDGGGAYGPGPYDLDTQIRGVMDAVAAARIDLGRGGGARHGEPFDDVVLLGHSVGSYIALDVFRRHMHTKAKAPKTTKEVCLKEPLGGTGHLNLRLGILLFATLVHLSRSRRGQKLERVLLTTPMVSGWADVLAQAAVWWLLPVWAMSLIVQYVLCLPPHAASVTLRFLSSRGGVRQALYLGRDELQRIGPDEWEDELWEVVDGDIDTDGEAGDGAGDGDGGVNGHDKDGSSSPSSSRKFIILFGENDHWVANDVRDEFIARRNAHKKSRAHIVLDERGWPHDFCIRHGEEVAETVNIWIADLVDTL